MIKRKCVCMVGTKDGWNNIDPVTLYIAYVHWIHGPTKPVATGLNGGWPKAKMMERPLYMYAILHFRNNND